MELRQLRYFIAVADELHFGRAAERLHMTQPPLSAQIRKLEGELGVELFLRTTRQVRLTATGEELRRRLTDVLADLDRSLAGLLEEAKASGPQLSVGYTSSAANALVPRAVRLFRHLAPEVELSLQPLTTVEQIDQLQEGTLDLAIVRDAAGVAGLDAEVIAAEELVAHLPESTGTVDASRDTITPRELSRLGMISFPAELMPGYIAQVDGIFKGLASGPQIVYRTVHQESALGFVAAGLGFVILPASSRSISPEGVVVRRLTTPTTSVTSLVRRARSSDPACADLFTRCLREAAA